MIIDAKEMILGRLGTYAAKQALLGEEVIIVNSDQVVITGNKASVFADYKNRMDRGTFKGPFIFRRSDMFVKRSIRNMVGYKTPRGREALKRIKCFVGVPSSLKEAKMETIEGANIIKVPNLNYVTVKDICKHLGGKQ